MFKEVFLLLILIVVTQVSEISLYVFLQKLILDLIRNIFSKHTFKFVYMLLMYSCSSLLDHLFSSIKKSLSKFHLFNIFTLIFSFFALCSNVGWWYRSWRKAPLRSWNSALGIRTLFKLCVELIYIFIYPFVYFGHGYHLLILISNK